MSSRCEVRKCREYKVDSYNLCKTHLTRITKETINKIVFSHLENLGFDLEKLNLIEDTLGDGLGLDSLDVVELAFSIEKILLLNIPEDLFNTNNTIDEVIERTLLLCHKSKLYSRDNIDKINIIVGSTTNTAEKIDYIFKDKVYIESFNKLDLKTFEVKEALKAHLGGKRIKYATGIPNIIDSKLISLEMFLLSKTSLFIYSFTNKSIKFKNILLDDLNLDYEFLFNSSGEISSINLNFKTKKYISDDVKTFQFNGNQNISKTMIFLSKFFN